MIEFVTLLCQEYESTVASDGTDLRLEMTRERELLVYCTACWGARVRRRLRSSNPAGPRARRRVRVRGEGVRASVDPAVRLRLPCCFPAEGSELAT